MPGKLVDLDRICRSQPQARKCPRGHYCPTSITDGSSRNVDLGSAPF